MTSNPLAMIDLFAGAGGMSLGFRLAGYLPVVAVEYSPESARTYQVNHAKLGHNPKVFVEDITKRGLVGKVRAWLEEQRLPAPVVLTAGLPCETFSVAQRKRDKTDPRFFLYKRVLTFVRTLQPRIVVVENVPQLRTSLDGAVFSDLSQKLKKDKYGVTHWILNAADYGVPQKRTRFFLVAIKGIPDKEMPEMPPTKARRISIAEALRDLPHLPPESGQLEADTYVSEAEPGSYPWLMRFGLASEVGLSPSDRVLNHRAQRHRQTIIDRFARIRPREDLKDINANPNLPTEIKTRVPYTRHRRPVPDEPSYTVTAHVADELLHPFENRVVTPREAARLQSFPDWYEFFGPRSGHHGNVRTQDWYEQIGDAVPPLLARAIAEHLRPWLEAVHPTEEVAATTRVQR